MVDGQLTSCTEEDLFNSSINGALLGEEIIQFQTATLIATNTYRLTNLLRGRLGTEDKMSSHTTNEKFILLNSIGSNFVRVDSGLSLVNIARYYKAQSIGLALSEADSVLFTNTARCLKPYSPVQLSATRDISNNITFNWVRRTRFGGSWTDLNEVPLSEIYEKYQIDILTDDETTVVRTIEVTSPTAIYSAAEQTTDFGTVKNPVKIRIYQISDTVGRGIAASGAL